MDAAVKQGAFREDLFYRLSVVEIRVPPLRDRPEDLLPLARFFVQSLAKKLKLPNLRLDATCLEHLQRYSWPGNIRELQNGLERAAMLSRDGLLLPEGLPPAVREAGPVDSAAHAGPIKPLEETEREQIEAALRHTAGNRARAARMLGISTSTLWRKLRK
jgi:DNA-binding NtrC family response regulator